MWALVEIGEPALPVLRQRMVSADKFIGSRATLTAREILGPRASDELDQWILHAKTPEERRILTTARPLFKVASDNSKGKDPGDYRRERLKLGQERIEQALQNLQPSSSSRE